MERERERRDAESDVCRTMSTTKNQELILANEPWYHGLLPREDMKVLLTERGDFLVRFTDPKVGEPRKFVLSIFVGNGDEGIRHYVFRDYCDKFAIDEKWFNSIADLLNYHLRTKEPVANRAFDTVLIRAIGREPWEKQHSDVKLVKKLGEGAFGEVHMGEIQIANKTKKAAVKLAKLEALTKEQIKEIMHEARLMRRFNHPNVVTFYGVAAGQEPLMVIMELAENGALDSYLKKQIGVLTIAGKSEMIVQAARGLEYLHVMNVIHRDIASRNCLYGGGNVKISDFGLSREGATYKMNPHKRIPIRWLAPEVPRTGFYTYKSDVFAYGIMCWEVYHDGEAPYSHIPIAQVLPKVQEGYRMPFRDDVPNDIAQYITNKVCAGTDQDRCTMADVVNFLITTAGVEVRDDSYYRLPANKTASSPNLAQRNIITVILPNESHPVPTPAGATTQPEQLNNNKPANAQTPTSGVQSAQSRIRPKNRKSKKRKTLSTMQADARKSQLRKFRKNGGSRSSAMDSGGISKQQKSFHPRKKHSAE